MRAPGERPLSTLFFFLPGVCCPSFSLPSVSIKANNPSKLRKGTVKRSDHSRQAENSSSICPSAHCPLILPLFFHLSVVAQSPTVSTSFPCLSNHLTLPLALHPLRRSSPQCPCGSRGGLRIATLFPPCRPVTSPQQAFNQSWSPNHLARSSRST